MYYRRKVVLALIQTFGGRLEKIQLQKLLFLASNAQEKKSYEFVPYKYGCYSFSLQADLNVLVKKEIISEEEDYYEKSNNVNYFSQLLSLDQKILEKVHSDFYKLGTRDLIRYTYKQFPFYATRSVVAQDLLNSAELTKVERSKNTSHEPALFTIGYEGVSLEAYLMLMLRNNVALLVDVRNNPLSMKFGFSKTLLKSYCEKVGIDYTHIPQLGIEATKRINLETQKHYNSLFKEYKEVNLRRTGVYQSKVVELIRKYKRVALTCFEADICQCHRKPLAEAISLLTESKIPPTHLTYAPEKSINNSGYIPASIQKL